jgi:hypothetical protein
MLGRQERSFTCYMKSHKCFEVIVMRDAVCVNVASFVYVNSFKEQVAVSLIHRENQPTMPQAKSRDTMLLSEPDTNNL